MKVTKDEVFEGAAGTGVKLNFELDSSDRRGIEATLGTWFLTCPGQSPVWSHFIISCVHLRQVEGIDDARLDFPDATHEFLLLALDSSMNPKPEEPSTWRHFLPVNFTGQYMLDSDEQAKKLLDLAARAIVTGDLWAEPPLSGQREPWNTVMKKTIEHLQTGGHDD